MDHAEGPLWDGEGPLPMRRMLTKGVPDLTRIARHRWESVLLPLDPARRFAARHNPRLALGDEVAEVFDGLPAPLPDLVLERRPERRSTVQVNIRVPAAEHRRLAAVAELTGGTPTGVARQFVLAGVRRTLIAMGPEYVELLGLEDAA